MPDKVNIIQETDVFKKYIFRVVEAKLRHEKFDGTMSDEIIRLNLERGDGVASLLHDPADDTLVMVEQFRYPTYSKASGWLMELAAGIVEPHEDPAETMHREIIEETGYEPLLMRHIHTFFLSPGGSSERIFLYYAQIQPQNKLNDGGGSDDEGEDIRVHILPVDDVLQRMNDGNITDAKTIIALQWLQLNRNNLMMD